MAGSLLAAELMTFSKYWKLDGDLIRCQSCGRGIHCTNSKEPLHHASDCKNSVLLYPWHNLQTLANAVVDAENETSPSVDVIE